MEERNNGGISDAPKPQKAVPSSITVNVRQKMSYDDIKVQRRREIPKGLLAGLIAVGSLLVVGIIVVGVLLITQPQAAAAVDAAPTATQSAEAQATPSATPAPTQTPEPIQTTAPEESDDISSIFEAPTNPILQEEPSNQ